MASSLLKSSFVAMWQSNRWAGIATKVKWLCLAISLAGVVLPTRFSVFLSVVIIACSVGLMMCEIKSRSVFQIARNARRRALIEDAFGTDESQQFLLSLEGDLSGVPEVVVAECQGKAVEFYNGTLLPGPLRFEYNVRQSVFWGKHLYFRCLQREAAYAVLIVLACIAILILTLGYAGEANREFVSRLMICLLSIGVLLSDLDRVFRIFVTYREMSEMHAELRGKAIINIQLLIRFFVDYQVLAAVSPPVSDAIFERNRSRLNSEWEAEAKLYAHLESEAAR